MSVDRAHAFAVGPLRTVPDAELGVLRRALGRLVVAGLNLADALAFEVAVLSFARGAMHGADLRVGPRAYCLNRSGRERVRIGDGVICRGVLRAEHPAGRIELGDGVYLGDDCIVSAACSVKIGAEVMLAHGVQVFDNDSHPVDAALRRADRAAIFAGRPRPAGAVAQAPVEIGPGAWIGMGSLVMKGVHIGADSIVAAGSVVVRDVPAGCVVAGSPARVVKDLRVGDRGA
jgi:acetyltransferase-like isoleucine patch superfamily enzyme